MRKPNFFVVGAPKCGTSSTYFYLLQHPDIFLPHVPDISTLVKDPFAHDHQAIQKAVSLKEPHFFGSDLHFLPSQRAATNLDSYLALFKEAGGEKRVGEASVWYLRSENAAEEIFKFAPDARIIIMIRDPVEVMFRLHGQACLIGSETIADFEAALAAEPKRIENPELLPRNPVLREFLFYRQAVQFTAQIKRYFDRFGREQTHVVVFDDLKADSAQAYRDMLNFLGVDDQFIPSRPRVNPMSQVKSLRMQRVLSNPPNGLRTTIRAMLPLKVRQWLVSRVTRLNIQYGSRPALDQSVRQRLQADLADEVRSLSELLGRDLTHWSRE